MKKEDLNQKRNEFAHGTKIIGDLHSKGTIRFDGEIQGNIFCESKIVIGKEGVVKGNVQSQEAEISGSIEGQVDVAGFLSCTPTCEIKGNIEYGKIKIEEGAHISGSIAIKSGSISNDKKGKTA